MKERPTAAQEARRPKRSGVPPLRYELVGHQQLLERTKKQLLNGEDVALYGVRGIGKTVIAHALAQDPDIAKEFSDYILWVTLGEKPGLYYGLRTLGSWLGLTKLELDELGRDQNDLGPLQDGVMGALQDQRALLIIDDAWATRDALKFQLGQRGFSAHLLTTRFPGVALDFKPEPTQVEELADPDAMALFRRLAPAFIAERQDATERCVKLAGGLPLAIVLIARHLNRSAKGPRHRLEEALADVLNAESRLKIEEELGPRDSERSLSEALALTVEPLPEGARRALEHLSVFPAKLNTFSREAAAAVSDSADALDELWEQGLVEVLRAKHDGPQALQAESDLADERFTMHQAIADYAAEARKGDETAFRRMADYLTGLAARTGSLEGEQKDVLLSSLDREHENIRAALDWCIRTKTADMGMELASALFDFWYEHAYFTEGRDYIDDLLALPASDDERTRAKLLNDSGNYAYSQANLAESENRYQESLTLRRDANDEGGVAGSRNNLGLVYRERGELDKAKDEFSGALESNKRLVQGGALEPEKLRLHRNWQGRNLNNLAITAEYEGDLEEAQELQERSRAVFAECADKFWLAMVAGDLASVLLRLRRLDDASSHFQESLRLRSEIQDGKGISVALRGLARTEAERHRYDLARRLHLAALSGSMIVGDRGGVADGLLGLTDIALAEGKDESAATWLGAVRAFRSSAGFAEPPVDQKRADERVDLARERLGHEQFSRCWKAGAEAELGEIARQALGDWTSDAESVVAAVLAG